MSELVSLKQLADELKVTEETAQSLITSAKLKPHKLKVSGSDLLLFDKDESGAIVKAYLDAQKKIQEAKEAAREPTQKEIMLAIKAIHRDVEDVAELQEEIKRITASNQAIFKAFTEFKSETTDKLAGLKTLINNSRDEFVKLTKVAKDLVDANQESMTLLLSDKEGSQAKKATTQTKVAVVGISKIHHPTIAARYAKDMDLKLVDPSDIKGIYQLRGFDIVFAMRKHTDVRHSEQMKLSKIVPKYVEGGIDELKEALDSIIA